MVHSVALQHVIDNGIVQPPKGINPGRWRGIVKRILSESYLPPSIKVENYGAGVRWHCTRCDCGHNGYLPTILYNNSPPPKQCPKCGGEQIKI